MNDALKTGFADRLETAAAAKLKLLEKMRPRPTVTDPLHDQRAIMKQAELDTVRADRAEARAAARQAAADAETARQQAISDAENAALQAKRGQRKERKALSAAESKAKRDAKYAARQARR